MDRCSLPSVFPTIHPSRRRGGPVHRSLRDRPIAAESRGLGCSEGLTRRVLGGGPLRVEPRWAGADRRMAPVAFEVGRVMTDRAGRDPSSDASIGFAQLFLVLC